MKKMKTLLTREDGVTLVELLAAIILLSIIVVSFMGFFTQAARTNSRTNAVNEATFLAQQEIELITHYSSSGKSFEELNDSDNDYGFINGKRQTSSNGYEINTKIATPSESEPATTLYKISVIVKKGGEARAQMETHLPFKETTVEPIP
ncbi:MAG: hypothetical protein GX777_04970 [Fastidiosipila sp.]|nr:hypothetical protein [Fastidiosipila sp.]